MPTSTCRSRAALQRHQPRPREARRHQSTVPHSAALRGCASHRAPRVCHTRRPRHAASTSSGRLHTSSRVTNHLCRTRRRVSVRSTLIHALHGTPSACVANDVPCTRVQKRAPRSGSETQEHVPVHTPMDRSRCKNGACVLDGRTQNLQKPSLKGSSPCSLTEEWPQPGSRILACVPSS